MDEGLLNRIEAALDSSLFEIRIIVPNEIIPLMINRNINRTADLVTLAFGQISPETADWLVATLGYTQVIVLSLNYGTQLLGTIVAFMAEEQTEAFDYGLKTFAYMAGLALTRKKAEEALQRSEQQFRAIIENSADAIALLSAEGIILYESPAVTRLLGYQPEDMLDHNAFEFLHPDDQVIAGTILGQILRQPQQSAIGQFRYRHKDGTWHWVEATGTNLLDTPGIQAIVVNYSDITARRQAEETQAKLEERLRQAQKMESIGLLAGGVAHDFNNLLTVILGYSDLIEAKLPRHDPLFDEVEQIRQSGKRAESLVRQLLAFSRKQMLTPIVLDLNDLIANLKKMLGRLIGEDITLSTSLQPGLWTVIADPGQMEQVIMNLAANARDAMPMGGQLTLETGNIVSEESQTKPQVELLPGPYVRLRMTDTGQGMDKSTLTHLFEPFFTTKEQGKGTGLGLATVYGIIKQSEGEITVNSQPGQGTTFEIYLPAHKTTSSSQVSPQPDPDANQGCETILLVEDEKMVRDVVRLALQSYGYRLLEADHGYQALALAQQQTEPIDLLLTDVVMPQMSGSELAERLKALHPQIKVLF
ncbi:MAG: PAS domain S-box protein, partial [Anaerolineales bacterium]|nr:PAS domain S-box protein [Anaerolineales bacterium]